MNSGTKWKLTIKKNPLKNPNSEKLYLYYRLTALARLYQLELSDLFNFCLRVFRKLRWIFKYGYLYCLDRKFNVSGFCLILLSKVVIFIRKMFSYFISIYAAGIRSQKREFSCKSWFRGNFGIGSSLYFAPQSLYPESPIKVGLAVSELSQYKQKNRQYTYIHWHGNLRNGWKTAFKSIRFK